MSTVNIDGIIYHDPRGKIVFFDDFEDGGATVRWVKGGTSSTTAIDTTYAFRGADSMKMTTNNVADATCSITFNMGPPKNNYKMGLACNWMSTATLAKIKAFELKIVRYTGALVNTAKAQWLGTDATAQNKWQYHNSSAAWADITDASQKIGTVAATLQWHFAKLVADLANNTYIRVISDDQSWAFTSAFESAADTSTEPGLSFTITLTAEAATAIDAWIDNVIVTVMEK
jgi:hypothetical protein